MYRFFCNPKDIKDNIIVIKDKKELHHIIDVLRFKIDDRITVLDGEGGKYFTKIIELDKKHAKLEVFDRSIYKRGDLHTKLTVACAWVHKDKISCIVQKLTELAVDRIILINTERTKIKPKDTDKKIEKLKKISKEALKQSGSQFLPEIEYMKFPELLKISNQFDLALIPNLNEHSVSIRVILNKFLRGNILVAIGPEGDFSDKEIKQAENTGFVSVTLGDTVLKVDTAAIVVAGFVRLRTLLLGKEA